MEKGTLIEVIIVINLTFSLQCYDTLPNSGELIGRIKNCDRWYSKKNKDILFLLYFLSPHRLLLILTTIKLALCNIWQHFLLLSSLQLVHKLL